MYKNIESYILKIKFLLVLLFLSISNLTAQTIRINEVVSSNSQHTDEDGDTPDWLELHNYGTENISISNWALTDDEDDLTKWTFPSFTLAPDQYLLIWASKKDRSSAANELHTNFKISSSLETLTLTNTSGTFVDQITAENLTPDTSIGVSINSGTLVVFSETTPGDENSNNEYQGTIQSEVVFSHEGGLVGGPISLVLSGNTSGEEIRYTIGGNTTTETATLYTSPIAINANTSVRAQIFAENHIPSPVYTKSYILNANHEIDVMLLTTDPDDFFDEDTGIYVFGPNDPGDFPYRGANFWKDWERPIHFAFYENGENTSVEFNAGVKIFGGWSRANRQRSLALFARSQYGDSKFEHSFFDELNYNEFESLVLRNSGLDWLRTQMKDIALSSLMRGSGLDFQEHTPVATYLNGEYWGMYNLREKVNEHMLASKYNIDADDITLLDDDAVEDESNAEYNQLINYLSTTDLTIDSNFEYVAQEIDIEQYVLYHATEIFFNNNDWPGNNIKFWKYPEGKWRWVMFDTDNGFRGWSGNALNRALADDGPDHPNPPESTLPFRRLVTNIGFRNIFINRYADELNTRFLPHKVKAHIDQTYSTIQSEVNAHFQRWNSDIARVTLYMNEMKTFADNRPTVAKNRIKSNFNLPAYHTITIINPEIPEGFVEVNSNLNIQEASWTGDYFETVPIQLKATAESGFEFSHWSGDISSTDETISLTLVSNLEVTPNFSPTSSNDAIVINEINYKSSDSFDANDWVELYNPNTTSVDLANWELKDNNDSNIFILPEGTTIDAGGYIVLVKNSSDFSSVFPEITNFIGDIDFGFGSSDAVRLFDVNSLLQDEVNYLSEAPWSDCADETGNTLQLITPDLDNALPDSWSCINSNGSPNAINGSPVAQDPIAEAGSNKVITLPTNSITFNGSGIDPDGGAIVSYAWTQESGPSTTTLNEASTTALTTNDLEEGTYVFRLTVVDDEGDSSFDEVSVVVYPEASSVNIVGSANLVDATYLEGSRNPSPTGPILRAEGGNREIYLKFDLSSFKDQIVQVELSMQVSSDPGNGTLEVFLGSDSNWTETGLNGTNKPVAV
uniref:CotH kinase family protein n=1 Tax=Maribacter antarcticus TaxID=505250 RepID=UPI00055DB320